MVRFSSAYRLMRRMVRRLLQDRHPAGGNEMLSDFVSASAMPKLRNSKGLAAALVTIFLVSATGCAALTRDATARKAIADVDGRSPSTSTMATADRQNEDALVALLSPDWGIGDGHFYTQTNGRSVGVSATGFAVTNREGVTFWDKFTELGGVSELGFPLSRRFDWRGSPTQVFHRGVLQWDPVSQQVLPVNILDELSDAGKDGWLKQQYSTPYPLSADYDDGKSWDKIVEDRLSLLNGSPAIADLYAATANSMALYGLPTSQAEDFGSFVAMRFQRAVIRARKGDPMGASASYLVVEHVGEWAIEAGLFPAQALVPEPAPTPLDTQPLAPREP
ncbi:MAG: hypothetical protein HYY30_03115 [Chloroflexi bacterium]|nr:hypothetical protein [Chloroflexota bacterium]